MNKHSVPRHAFATLCICAASLLANAGEPHFPGKTWEPVPAPEALGWDTAKLKAARDYAKTIPTAAVMIIVEGRVLAAWGDTATKYNVHSIRKSFLSALYGISVSERTIRLTDTMLDLGIDDNAPSLTDIEKTATVDDLLKARSGIYHPALYEAATMAAARPERGSHAPGTFWYYNNWDFNALGTIYEKQTGTGTYSAFKTRIAEPLEMEDFWLGDGKYVTGRDSIHRAYPFRMTARDMARFGLLFLREGNWRGKQIVPKDWVAASITSYSDARNNGGYGYMWWIAANGKHLPKVRFPEGSYSARGNGGHYILVVPKFDLVIVHRVNTDRRGNAVSAKQFGGLVRRILEAKRAESQARRQ
ncbi:MAG: serine hydrolase [Betaproteobacteria bacterium]|nr:serine hydrolase [Betaproteobacteria bacterium]